MKKKPGDVIILHKCAENHDHILYCSWDMLCDTCNSYFPFWAIFCPFTPLTAWKIKILKKWENWLEISSFYICVSKIMIRWCMVPEICCATDVWMDGQKKWHIEVGAPPKNFSRSTGLPQLYKTPFWKKTDFLKNIFNVKILLQKIIYIENVKVTEISYPQS